MKKFFAMALLTMTCLTGTAFVANAASAQKAAEQAVEEAVITEGETGLQAEDGGEKFAGTWAEEIAGRGFMEVMPSGNGKYYVTVDWSSSAAEKSAWNFTAIYDSETGDLTYDDGTYRVLLFDENGGEEVKEEKSVKGKLHMEDGKILWTDSVNGETDPSTFIAA